MADPIAQWTAQALELASAGADLYLLLDLTPTAGETDIRRAWRKVGLKYHPDRVGDDASAKETYERCRVARDVLLEPAARGAYDSAREADVRRQVERENMDRARRDMVEDLERREAMARGELPRGTASGWGMSMRSAEEEERLRRAFARGREIEKERKRRMDEAEGRERLREEEAMGKSLGELDREEEELEKRLDAVRERKAAKEEARRAKRSKGVEIMTQLVGVEEADKIYGSGRRKERARLMAEQEREREREREMKAQMQQQPPPPPANFDPNKKYGMDDFENTLTLLTQAQEAKIAAGETERLNIPLEEKSFDMPGGRTISVPRYSFNYRAMSKKRRENPEDGRMEGVEHTTTQARGWQRDQGMGVWPDSEW